MSGGPYSFVKRVLDLLFSALLLVLTFPIQLVIAGLVAANLGTPVLFKQPRPGRGGRVFTLVKFRSMKPIDAHTGRKSDEQRLTRFGKLLRSTSLDELPTLWNVFRGDMSFVGPRPLLVDYLELYSSEQARRHEVRPGITGLAQVRGRNSLSWDEKFNADLEYVQNYSFLLDSRICFRTILVVVSRSGVSSEREVTMHRFEGQAGNTTS